MARRSTSILLSTLLALLTLGAGRSSEPLQPPRPSPGPDLSVSSSTNGHMARRTAGTDSFVLYGGPGTLEGKFEDASGHADWQGWEGVDLTEIPIYWQVSTHNAANLGDHGAGNRAYWCGVTEEQAPHFFHTPGYGSNWDAKIMYESGPVADPSVGQTVSLDFLFNVDTEPGYDFLFVEFERDGTWQQLNPQYTFDGTNRDINNDFPVPGLRFSDLSSSSFDYSGNDYGGDSGDRIRVRIRFLSDGAFDDQTGLWPTIGGACQIDDITLTHDGGAFFEDFEGAGPYLFEPVIEPFAGDFGEIWVNLQDLDPYRENQSPVVAFIDYGQEPRNGPGVDGTTSTGGSTSPNWNYGSPGGHVVNYTGGLTAALGEVPLNNQIWSPWIQWDLPGTEDDGVDVAGAVLSFDVYGHLELADGIFFEWFVGPGNGKKQFLNDNTVWFGVEGPLWERFTVDVSDRLRPDRYSEIRIALGVHDYASIFGFPGMDATPAPYFDNVRLVKYRLDGPVISSDWNGVFNNGWPYDLQEIDLTTPASRDAMDVGLDGTAEVEDIIRPSSIVEVRVVWALKKNPVFEDAIRLVPAPPDFENVVTGPDVWTGDFVVTGFWGNEIDFNGMLGGAFYPGDQLEYYVQATDDDGRVTTLPAALGGFGNFDGSYDPRFRVRGLPSFQDTAGTQPWMLVYAGGAERSNLQLVRDSLAQLALEEGVDYDVFARRGLYEPMLAPGATPAGLQGYQTILFFAGGGYDYDYPDWGVGRSVIYPTARMGVDDPTLSLLTDWADLPGDRLLVTFGALPGFSLANGEGLAPSFLASELGIQLVADDLRPAIGGQASPGIEALGPGFVTDFAISGSGRKFLALEHVEPIAPAVRGHAFQMPGGGTHPTAAGSVLKVETVGTDTKTWLTFPYSFQFLQSPVARANPLSSARVHVLEEALQAGGIVLSPGIPTAAPAVHHARMHVQPNPFNPSTTIALTLPVTGPASVKVFDLRGRLVRTLHDGRLDAGPHDLAWDGRDDRGAALASGVYLVRASYEGGELRRKALLVK